jgi:Insertion element 4 transposase N-terminal/Transposase DDE domain
MHLDEAFSVIPVLAIPEAFDRFQAHIDPVWVEEALLATGTATVRRRRLSAEQVVWLVIGMALMRNQSIERVVALLDLALPSVKGDTTAKSAITQARQRLGEEPMAYLFNVTAEHWAHSSARRHEWRGLALYGVDGTTTRVPDSPENWNAFGGQCGNGSRNGSAYPMVRVVALMALRSHLVASWQFADYATGETSLAKELWRELPGNSLTIADRNYLVADELCAIENGGGNRHWLTRAKKITKLRRIKKLGANDELVEIVISSQTRRHSPNVPAVWTARAIRYQRKGFPPSVLLTSLLDPIAYPASEIVALYHERWELEIGYDEIKTHLLERQEAIRSKTPAAVRQELWGIGLAYNLVRLEMERAADEAGVAPSRISFVNALARENPPPALPPIVIGKGLRKLLPVRPRRRRPRQRPPAQPRRVGRLHLGALHARLVDVAAIEVGFAQVGVGEVGAP